MMHVVFRFNDSEGNLPFPQLRGHLQTSISTSNDDNVDVLQLMGVEPGGIEPSKQEEEYMLH